MKIILIQESYLPQIGGAEFHVFQLAKELVGMGYEISVVTGTRAVKGRNNGDVCPVFRHRIIKGRIFSFPLWFYRILTYSRDVDVIHVHFSSFLAFTGAIAGYLLGKRVVMTLHGYGTLDSNVKNSPLKKMYRYVSMKLANCIIATSEEMKEVALRYTTADKIKLITNGVDTEDFCPRKGKTFAQITGNMRIATLRRLVPKNGVHYVVDALGCAKDKLKYFLNIIGDGEMRELIEARVRSYGIAEKVKFHGALYHEDVVRHLEDIDIVMFMSTAESTSLAALECMSMGTIVVSSNAGAFPDLIRDGESGFIVDIFQKGQSNYNAPEKLEHWQYDRIVEKLIQILNLHPEELQRISRNARAHVVKCYDWAAIAEKTARECYCAK